MSENKKNVTVDAEVKEVKTENGETKQVAEPVEKKGFHPIQKLKEFGDPELHPVAAKRIDTAKKVGAGIGIGAGLMFGTLAAMGLAKDANSDIDDEDNSDDSTDDVDAE